MHGLLKPYERVTKYKGDHFCCIFLRTRYIEKLKHM